MFLNFVHNDIKFIIAKCLMRGYGGYKNLSPAFYFQVINLAKNNDNLLQ